MSRRRSGGQAEIFICAILAVLVLGTFERTVHNDFINFDDDAYVTRNSHVLSGPTLKNIAWAFTSVEECNWHPVTWISHMLDCRFYGPNPAGHHLTSLLIHLANTLLLFGILARMTKSRWPSAVVAALFAVHPLHVESVAWISQRKDVLSAFFGLLAIWMYARYVERPSAGRYALVVGAFALGLMSKPMLVTLPLVLLLLDYWPLGRAKSVGRWPLVREKIPLFLMSAAACTVTWFAQSEGMAVGSLVRLPLGERVANALVAYVAYIAKMVYPCRLAAFYPHPNDTLPPLLVLGSGILLTFITAACVRLRNRPYLLVGWLWYVVTLIPVIGLVQVGWQAMADRYTYMPLIGLFVMISWGVPEIVRILGKNGRMGEREKGRRGKSDSPIPPFSHSPILLLVAAVIVAVLAMNARVQTGYWRDSRTLFEHALSITRDNAVAENNLGMALSDEGETDAAVARHRKAIELEPEWADGHYDFGHTLLAAGRSREAIPEFTKALLIYPRDAETLNNLGAALMGEGKVADAVKRFSEAVRIKPDYVGAHMNLGIALCELGRWDKAITSLKTAVQLDPSLPDTHHNLAIALADVGDRAEAVAQCREALRLQPDWPDAQNNLAWMLATQKHPSPEDAAEAVRLAESACRATGFKDRAFLDTLAAARRAADTPNPQSAIRNPQSR